MLNSVAAGRRQARRVIAWQAAATLLVALACLWRGGDWPLAALAGGAAVMLAVAVAARISLGGGVGGAGPAVARLLAGVLAKWLVLAAVLLWGMRVFGLPPLPMLVAVVAALVAQVPALALHR